MYKMIDLKCLECWVNGKKVESLICKKEKIVF